MTTKHYSDLAIHPGEHLREEIGARKMTQTELANRMGRPVTLVNAICRERKAITAATALDLERALEISAESWLNLQQRYDLILARQDQTEKLQRAANG